MQVKADTALANTELMPMPGSDFSIAPALQIAAQLVPFQDAAKELAEQADRAVIDSPGAKQNGVEFASICQEQWAQLEVYRKATTGPVYDYWKYMLSLFAPIQASLDASKRLVLGRMVQYDKAEQVREQARLAALRKQQEEEALKLAQEREAQGDTKGAEAIMEAATTAPAPRPMVTRTVASSSGRSFKTRKTWTAQVEKPMDVLKAILDGKLPISLIKEWSQVELNKCATQIKVEMRANGLHIFEQETGSV